MGKNIIPENDLQELWELQGRVNAVLTYIDSEEYPTVKIIHRMLTCGE